MGDERLLLPDCGTKKKSCDIVETDMPFRLSLYRAADGLGPMDNSAT